MGLCSSIYSGHSNTNTPSKQFYEETIAIYNTAKKERLDAIEAVRADPQKMREVMNRVVEHTKQTITRCASNLVTGPRVSCPESIPSDEWEALLTTGSAVKYLETIFKPFRVHVVCDASPWSKKYIYVSYD